MNRHMIFPNTKTIAMYNSLSQTIELSDIKRSRLDSIMLNPICIENIEDYCTLVHEANHYYDNISTLRGLRMLLSLYNAYNAIYKETQEEKNMWRIVDFNNSIKSMKFENYYKMVEKHVDDSDYRNWSFSQSIGFRYNYKGHLDYNKPIIFNRFKYKEKFIARIPISIESMWENSSIAIELELKSKVIESLPNQFEKVIEFKDLSQKTVEWIYNTHMLIYSNVSHLVGRFLVVNGDIYKSFMYSKKLASLSLNLPDKYFRKIKIPESIRNLVSSEHIDTFIENRDISFMFICLLYNIQELKLVDYQDDIIGNDLILKCSGLPREEEIFNEIKQEIKKIKEEITDGYYKERFLSLCIKGDEVLDKRGLFNNYDYSTLDIRNINDLPIICSDEVCDDSEIMKWYEEVEALEIRIKEFIEACGY